MVEEVQDIKFRIESLKTNLDKYEMQLAQLEKEVVHPSVTLEGQHAQAQAAAANDPGQYFQEPKDHQRHPESDHQRAHRARERTHQ